MEHHVSGTPCDSFREMDQQT